MSMRMDAQFYMLDNLMGATHHVMPHYLRLRPHQTHSFACSSMPLRKRNSQLAICQGRKQQPKLCNGQGCQATRLK